MCVSGEKKFPSSNFEISGAASMIIKFIIE